MTQLRHTAPKSHHHHHGQHHRKRRSLRITSILLTLAIAIVVTSQFVFLIPRVTTTATPETFVGKTVPQRIQASSSSTNTHQKHPPASSKGTSDKNSTNSATFNGVSVVYKETTVHSRVHCVGGNHQPDAWKYQSCHFRHFCFDASQKEFVLIQSPMERQLDGSNLIWSSSTINTSVALGGINPRWMGVGFDKGIEKVRWFPRVIDYNGGYYELPSNVVMLPFHSLAAHNVGHLLFDDLLPMFILLQMFGMQHQQLLILRHVVPNQMLYGTCEMRKKKRKQCETNLARFLPLLGVNPETYSTNLQARLENGAQSHLICAKHGLAGLGMLTDHGEHDHGWAPLDTKGAIQNLGRGPLLFKFRNFVLENMGLPVATRLQVPYHVVFSVHSSRDWYRNKGFENQTAAVARSCTNAQVQSYAMWNMTLRQQLEVAVSTSVFVTAAGGGAVTAAFLPRGSSLILFYDEQGGFDFASFNLTGTPAYLDWDLFNNAAHLRVHWMPLRTMDSAWDIESLVYLIQNELDLIGELDAT